MLVVLIICIYTVVRVVGMGLLWQYKKFYKLPLASLNTFSKETPRPIYDKHKRMSYCTEQCTRYELLQYVLQVMSSVRFLYSSIANVLSYI